MSAYHQVCLAGLDTMVLHLHNRTPSLPATPSDESQDTSSYLEITCNTVDIKGLKARRTPLGDRTPSLNTTVLSTISSTFHPSESETTASVKRRSSSPHTTRARLHPIVVHKALPDVPSSPVPSTIECTPVLRQDTFSKPLPSLPMPSPTNAIQPPSPLTEDVSTELNTAPHEQLLEIAPPVPPKSQEIHYEPYDIPTPEHPNSPYVPWSSPTRRRIIHRRPSHASIASFATMHSNSSRYRRSGARAPEPPELYDDDSVYGAPSCMDGIKRRGKVQALQLKRSIKNLKRTVVKKVSAISKPLSKFHFHHDQATVVPPETAGPETPVVLDIRTLTPPISASETSVASFASSAGTASLTAWLSERRRESLEQDMERDEQQGVRQWGMTLDEYERNGSWLDIRTEDEEYDSDMIDGLTEDINSPLNFTEDGYTEGGDEEGSINTPRASHAEWRLSAVAIPRLSSSSSSPIVRRSRSLPLLHICSLSPTLSVETIVPNVSVTSNRTLYADRTLASSDGMLAELRYPKKSQDIGVFVSGRRGPNVFTAIAV